MSVDNISPVDWVDPNIGGIAHLLAPTIPTVQLPHGMIRLAPTRLPGPSDLWLSDRIMDFPLNIISHRGPRIFSIMAMSGELKTNPRDYASEADHDLETADPYAYSVLLEDSDIEVSCTVTEHAMIYRFKFLRPGASHVVFKAGGFGYLNILPGGTDIAGFMEMDKLPCYFYARSSRSFDSYGTWTGLGGVPNTNEAKAEGKDVGTFLTYDLPGTSQDVEFRIGISYISREQAKENMEREVAGKTFEQIAEQGRSVWNDALGSIMVEGGTERERRIFYTALWRSHERMINVSEYGRYFSGYDHQVHDDEGTPFYVDDWTWDTHRCLHSLQMILNPARKLDMLRSYARMIKQSGGWAPTFPLVSGNHAVMIGNHVASITADAWAKGLRDFDIETVYSGLRKNAMEGTRLPWSSGPATELDQVYVEKGFFPALEPGQEEWVKQAHSFERRQAVAVTLEHSYDDWCMSELAEDLGKTDDAEVFRSRSKNYRNLYNSETGFMSPKSADGKWIEPFDPSLCGGQGGREYFAECNSWTYTWSVPHDVLGLMELMGGRERFIERLDQLFNAPLGTPKYHFLSQFPDATGLIGQFPIGNEPGFLVPYLYIYGGAPWRTQKRVRQLMDIWFDDDPLGICGDDDGGALSSWYVFTAMGFYPLCPGKPVYGIGSPLFEKVTIELGTGGTFTIEAKNASKRNKYIQSATLNCRPLNQATFNHSDLIAGGSLVLEMGPRPNKSWGCE